MRLYLIDWYIPYIPPPKRRIIHHNVANGACPRCSHARPIGGRCGRLHRAGAPCTRRLRVAVYEAIEEVRECVECEVGVCGERCAGEELGGVQAHSRMEVRKESSLEGLFFSVKRWQSGACYKILRVPTSVKHRRARIAGRAFADRIHHLRRTCVRERYPVDRASPAQH